MAIILKAVLWMVFGFAFLLVLMRDSVDYEGEYDRERLEVSKNITSIALYIVLIMILTVFTYGVIA